MSKPTKKSHGKKFPDHRQSTDTAGHIGGPHWTPHTNWYINIEVSI